MRLGARSLADATVSKQAPRPPKLAADAVDGLDMSGCVDPLLFFCIGGKKG